MKKIFILLVIVLSLADTLYSHGWVNISDKGADVTGNNKCTEVINRMIDSLATGGGGTLFFPAGTFLTGPIMLKSNITLYFDAGSLIKFSDDFDDYLPMVQSRWEDIRVRNFKSQIYAYKCENITITGRGRIDGQGEKWWNFMKEVNSGKQTDSKWQQTFRRENAEKLAGNEYLRSKGDFLRPPMITIYECNNVLIEGVSLTSPPFWTVMPAFSENITIQGLTIDNPSESPNTDGIDPSSCRNVHISNCHITVGDDCIVIKSGRDEDGRDAGRPTENITITNCTMLKGHGGVVIGSEMSGDVRNIAISNCIFEGTDRGIRIKTMRGRGGVVEDIRISNIVMYNMLNEGILVTLRYQPTNPEPLSERTPSVNGIHISGIIVKNAQRAVAIYGLEERDASNITFSDMQIYAKSGILLENVSDVRFHDVRMAIANGSPLEAKDSKGITWDNIAVKVSAGGSPFLRLIACSDIRVTNCFQPEQIRVFVGEDEKCDGIYIVNNILPGTEMLFSNKGKNLKAFNNVIKN
jgi:polygalacturonase